MTYCELREDTVCFLVHVPQLKRYKREVRDALIDLAWQSAQATTEGLRSSVDRKLGVGLRGALFYGGLVVGMGKREPGLRKNAGVVSPSPLYPFFVEKAVGKGASEPVADTASVQSGG